MSNKSTFVENLLDANRRRLARGLPYIVSENEKARSEARRENERRRDERELRDMYVGDFAGMSPDEAWDRANFGAVSRNGGQKDD